MTEEAAPESIGPQARAGEKYEVVVKKAPQPERALRWFGSLLLGLVSQGAWGAIPGGQRILVKELESGETVAKFKQGFDEDFDTAGDLMGQLKRLSINDFERACGISSS